MKFKYKIAVLLTVLLLIPISAAWAEESPAFSIDQRQVLYGMNRSWLQGYEPTVAENYLSLIVPIASDRAQGQIQAELIPADESLSPFKAQTMSVRVQQGENGLWAVRMSLELYADRRNGDYPCYLRVTGTDRQGSALRTDIPFTLRIRDGLSTRETLRMTLTDVEAEMRVGEDGCVRAVLTNPCRTVRYEQIVLRIVDPAGDVIPRTVDVMYLDDLAPGESAEIAFPVTVLPTSSVSPHRMQFRISWVALGQNVSQEEVYTLPVTQEIRLEQGGLKMASSVVAGDSITLSLPLMNMGRAEVINVLATVSLPGITDRQSVLVGTVSPGETRQAQITLTPGRNVSGDFDGTLTVEGTDSGGNPTSFALPIHLTVEKPAVTAAAVDSPTQEKETSPLLLYALAGGCGLLLVILILQSVLLTRKIHRLEEDKL